MRSSRARGLVRALSAQRQAPVIPAKLSVHAPEWAENAAIMQGHLDELRRRLALQDAVEVEACVMPRTASSLLMQDSYAARD